MSNELHRIMTDETGKQIAEALENLVAATKESSIEYGVRFLVGAQSSRGERVTRQNGVISPWNITFTRNINNNAPNCPFSSISLFAPALWVDAGGNVFRRFERFYYCEETVGNYRYVWVCRTKATENYRLPKAFLPNWRYRDIAVYEGGSEVVNGTTHLCSKTGTVPMGNMTRTVAYQRATAWHKTLGITDTRKERYMITPMSEITEILQPLLTIQMASYNSQDDGYRGHCDNSWDQSKLIASGQTDAINGLHGAVANDGLHSFKMLGIENIWGNVWKHVLDVTMLDRVPYVCDNLDKWTDTTTPNTDEAFAAVGYSVCTSNEGYAIEMGHDIQHPDVVLTTKVGGSSSTYYANYYWSADGARTVFFGGRLSDGSRDGLWYWDLSGGVGSSYWAVGARLSHASV